MNIELIYSTPKYHKLVETVARVCYQSYEKDSPTSHNFIKGPLAAGHISITSVGNMVFEVKTFGEVNLTNMLIDLTAFHEITPFIKWSFKDTYKNPNTDKAYISMNMLTFLDIYHERFSFNWQSNLLDAIIAAVDQVPHLRWFHDKSVELPESANEYTTRGIPKLYEPFVLDEDYTALKELGLNDYELGIHATITMNFMTDRSASLQFWRHWSGGCELSQRYVERGSAEFREMVGLSDLFVNELPNGYNVTDLLEELKDFQQETAEFYENILGICDRLGIRKGRAKEIARSILPNAIVTQCIQSRPYRNWLHLFKLRDSNHAQREIQEDVIHMKRVLREASVPTE